MACFVKPRPQRNSCPALTKEERLLLIRMRSFEAEDAERVPDVYRASATELTNPLRVSLHKLLGDRRECGKDPLKPVRGDNHITIAERKRTFTGTWSGPPADIMAKCGMIMTGQDRAKCYCCKITIRGLTAKDCIWSHHSDYAPNCLHLQRSLAHGIQDFTGTHGFGVCHEASVGNFIRSLSESTDVM